VNAQSDSAAYALLTRLASGAEVKTDVVGIASVGFPNRVMFYKGNVLAQVTSKSIGITETRLMEAARAVATILPNGDDEIPILVKHLPNSEAVANHAFYA